MYVVGMLQNWSFAFVPCEVLFLLSNRSSILHALRMRFCNVCVAVDEHHDQQPPQMARME